MSTQQQSDQRPIGSLQLGVQKYLYTGYFVAGCMIAYLTNQLVVKFWGESRVIRLAGMALSIETIANVAAVIVGIMAVVFAWRSLRIRTLAQETVDELAKVTWPTRQETYNATVVVLITSIVAAVLIFILDRFWIYATDMIYR